MDGGKRMYHYYTYKYKGYNVSIYVNCKVYRSLPITTIVITCKEEGLTLNC